MNLAPVKVGAENEDKNHHSERADRQKKQEKGGVHVQGLSGFKRLS